MEQPEEAREKSLEDLAKGEGFLPLTSELVVGETPNWMSIPKSFLLDIGGKELLRFEAISIGRNVWCEFAVVKLVIKYDMASWGNAFDVEYDDNVIILHIEG